MSIKTFRIKGFGWTKQGESAEAFAFYYGVDVNDVELVAEYACRLDYILRKLPSEFKSYVSSAAYDRGHAYGQDEIDGIAEGMVADLAPVVAAYTERILKEKS